ncbi:MAG TPA: 2-oxo acid dehydrogenase subunit E2 [Steroidobacteraceae bacterium]|jgi:pyruvate/2-oxoglutarate dehydrogenase complex dihydrolipoamide acyltransferase (E2) component|nr:2-oxo acid dehydrogenase subunit E2 [Steroidobacteraceae bacterium]HVY81476.1 2-oxo acid dehydrogenase subunit E2 [Steroidobacteraceae bacterium]
MREPSQVLVPQMNVNDDNAVIVAWQVPRGGRVNPGDVIATLETTKATFDVHAERAGYVFYEHEPKSIVAVGAVLAWIADDQNVSLDQLKAANAASVEPDALDESRYTRKALRRMRELGVTPDELPASGRIDVATVERVAAARAARTDDYIAARSASVTPAANPADKVAFELAEPLEQSPSKIIEAMRLSEVYHAIVPSLVVVPAAAERVEAKLATLAAGIGPVSLLELVLHETAALLADYRELNGFYAQGRAWTYREISIGFAVNAGKSLRVPIVRNTGQLSQLDICRAVRDLTLRYFREELSMQDVSGGTFTVTDLSGVGVTSFTPVLNERQSAILGLCAPDAGGQQNLVLAFDHRMSDGMRAATFLGELRERLET